MILKRAICFCASIGLMAMVGCQTSPAPAPIPAGPRSIDYSSQADTVTDTGEPVTPDTIVSTDPAAERLQDIGGFLLLYYSEQRQLPQSLDDLAQMPGGDSLDLTSPRTGTKFDYYPNGLWSSDHPNKCIVACDPVAGGSIRWCLLMTPPANGAALVVTVVAIPEQNFRKYHPQQ